MNGTSAPAADILLVGFGEAGQAFASGWGRETARRVAAYDVKTDDPALRGMMQERYAAHGIGGRATLGEALDGTRLVFSLVTADQALAAAAAAADSFPRGAIWLDCNSCAPDTKRRAAELVEAAGGSYVDVAVMGPVLPARHRVPLLLAGREAPRAARELAALGMSARVAGSEVGQASSIKMIRSVMMKGLEALSAECFLAARRAGVEDEVIASLDETYPGMGWRAVGAFNLERMMVHGGRRAAEMREVAETVAALGLPNRMAAATVAWQAEIASAGLEGGPDDFIDRADRILGRLGRATGA